MSKGKAEDVSPRLVERTEKMFRVMKRAHDVYVALTFDPDDYSSGGKVKMYMATKYHREYYPLYRKARLTLAAMLEDMLEDMLETLPELEDMIKPFLNTSKYEKDCMKLANYMKNNNLRFAGEYL